MRNTSLKLVDLVSEYRHRRLGYLVVRLKDSDSSGKAAGSDVTFEIVFDERWRAVASYRSGDDSPGLRQRH